MQDSIFAVVLSCDFRYVENKIIENTGSGIIITYICISNRNNIYILKPWDSKEQVYIFIAKSISANHMPYFQVSLNLIHKMQKYETRKNSMLTFSNKC